MSYTFLKKEYKLIFALVIFICPYCNLRSSNNDDKLPLQGDYFEGVYISIKYTRFSNVPISFESYNENKIKSSSSCPAFTIGYSFAAGDNSILNFGLEFEFSRTSFSDSRIENRIIKFYNGFVSFGVCLPVKSPLAIYGKFGGGVLRQLDYDNTFIWHEYLDEKEYPTIFGIGIKYSPVKNLILDFEICGMLKTWTETGNPVPGRPDWYYEKSGFEAIGRRVGIGISYIFGSKVGHVPWK
jgi:hypothetical protein